MEEEQASQDTSEPPQILPPLIFSHFHYLCPCNGRDIVLVVDILLLLLLLLQLAFAKPWPHIGLGLRLRQLFRKHVLF